jgi:hypothetical protein
LNRSEPDMPLLFQMAFFQLPFSAQSFEFAIFHGKSSICQRAEPRLPICIFAERCFARFSPNILLILHQRTKRAPPPIRHERPPEMHARYVVYCFALIGLLSFSATTSFAYTGQELTGKAKVTIEHARSIALKARPGAITDEELEKEKGGSGLRYSFDVKSGNVVYEVGVDAQTGKVLENSTEGPNPD